MTYDDEMAIADEARHGGDPIEEAVRLPATRREDRFVPGLPVETSRWLVASALLTLFVHAFIVAVLLRRDKTAALQVKPEATPIEIVVEPPKPPPEPPKPPPQKTEAPKPPPPPSLEKPATSAPRAANEEKVETQKLDASTHAPKAPQPPKEGQPESAAQSEAEEQEVKAEPDKAEESAKEDVLKDDAEALDRAAPKPDPKPVKPKPKKLVKATPRPKPRKPTDLLDQLAGASDLPDYTFARPSRRAPVSGGTEDNRYLAIVYGMIMQHRSLIGIPANVGGSVTIDFNVDDGGNVISIGVARTSGYPQIDAAAAAAIRRAAPFPPPPVGAPHSLIATIDFGPADDGGRR